MSDGDDDIRVLRARHYDEFVMTLTPSKPTPPTKLQENSGPPNPPMKTVKPDPQADVNARFLSVINRLKKPVKLEDEPLIDPLALLLKCRPTTTDEDEDEDQEYDDDDES